MAEWTELETRFDHDLVDSEVTEEVTYSGCKVEGVFELGPVNIDPDTGVELVSSEPRLGCRLSDLPKAPAEDDPVVARGVDYVVVVWEEHSSDWVEIRLHEA